MKTRLRILIILVVVTVLFVIIMSSSLVSSTEYSQNNMSDTSKVDPKVLQALKRINIMSNDYHTLVDVILEDSNHISNLPKDVEIVYSKNSTVGVAVNHDQIINLVGLDFVRQVTAPKGVFAENANVSMYNPPSPLKQFKAGILPKYVICKDGFDLFIIQRSYDSEAHSIPACFSYADAPSVQDRGIGKFFNATDIPYRDLTSILPTTNVFFMDYNHTGSISVKYISYGDEFGGRLEDLKPHVFKEGVPISTPDVTISSEPKVVSISDKQDTVTVTYVIKVTDTKGLYSLYIPQGGCSGTLPLAVGMNASEISSADLARYVGSIHCGVVSFESKIVNISGISSKWLLSEPYFQ